MINTIRKITTIKFTLLAVFAGLFLTVSAQAATITVDRTDDATVSTCTAAANDCTLRGAITAANGTAAADIINFDPAVFSVAQTITVTAQLGITGSATNTLTIAGPGAALLTISGGGAVRVFSISSGVTVQISGVTISEGVCPQGCAINNGGNLTLNNSVISNNGTPTTAGGGVGIFNGNGGNTASLTLNNSTVKNNQTISGSGVGIFSSGGTVTINNSTLSNNNGDADNTGTAASGGGIGVGGNTALTITNSTISGNISGNGNGIFISGATGIITITDTTINNNTSVSTGSGGGIFVANCAQTITIERTTIRDNTANAGGGGINKGGPCSMVINNSTISGNISTTGSGGGINNGSGSLTLNNSTVSGNSANAVASVGGGINNTATGGAVVTLESTTLSNNSVPNALNAGGFYNGAAASVATLNNTIIANSSNNQDCINNGTLNASYSLIEANLSCVNGTNSNNLTGDPNLAALGNNGGATQTHALIAGSIAIDAGNSLLTTDQRGSTRPFDLATYPNAGNGSDIGAVELQMAPTAASVSIGGRVLVGKGRGLANAFVILTDANGETRTTRTGSFGYYRFNDVAAGQTVIVTIVSKRYQFAPQVVSVAESIADLNFYAEIGN